MNESRLISCPGAPVSRKPLKDFIKHVFWDVGGTLFSKNQEMEKERKLIFYNAFALCKMGQASCLDPFGIKGRFIYPALEDVPKEVVEEFTLLVAHRDKNPNGKYPSKGALFQGEFGVDASFAPKLLVCIDYPKVLPRDGDLIRMFALLMDRYPGIPHNIMTNDVKETTAAEFAALGLDIVRFENPRIDEFFVPKPELVRGSIYANEKLGILCTYNTRCRKPYGEAFQQMLEVAGMLAEPERVLYVGNSEIKDIMPARAQGMSTVLAWTPKTESSADFNIADVHDFRTLFEG